MMSHEHPRCILFEFDNGTMIWKEPDNMMEIDRVFASNKYCKCCSKDTEYDKGVSKHLNEGTGSTVQEIASVCPGSIMLWWCTV